MNHWDNSAHRHHGAGTLSRRTWLQAFLTVIILVACCTACSESGGNSAQSAVADSTSAAEAHTASVENEEENLQQKKTYETVFDDYAERLRSATPLLIEEYNAEAADNDNGLNGLAEIANEKVGCLADLVNVGVEELAKVMYTTGSGKYEEYQDWATRLYDVYEEEASKIYDVYMNSAM